MSFIVNNIELHDYYALLDFMQEQLSQWNAYDSDKPLELKITKTKDESAIDVSVEDQSQTGDYFGGR